MSQPTSAKHHREEEKWEEAGSSRTTRAVNLELWNLDQHDLDSVNFEYIFTIRMTFKNLTGRIKMRFIGNKLGI